MLSSDINPSDPSLSDLTDANDIPRSVPIDDYGYRSDSDLDDDDGEPPVQSATVSTSPPQNRFTFQPENDDE